MIVVEVAVKRKRSTNKHSKLVDSQMHCRSDKYLLHTVSWLTIRYSLSWRRWPNRRAQYSASRRACTLCPIKADLVRVSTFASPQKLTDHLASEPSTRSERCETGKKPSSGLLIIVLLYLQVSNTLLVRHTLLSASHHEARMHIFCKQLHHHRREGKKNCQTVTAVQRTASYISHLAVLQIKLPKSAHGCRSSVVFSICPVQSQRFLRLSDTSNPGSLGLPFAPIRSHSHTLHPHPGLKK